MYIFIKLQSFNCNLPRMKLKAFKSTTSITPLVEKISQSCCDLNELSNAGTLSSLKKILSTTKSHKSFTENLNFSSKLSAKFHTTQSSMEVYSSTYCRRESVKLNSDKKKFTECTEETENFFNSFNNNDLMKKAEEIYVAALASTEAAEI